jgi:hypothetical protein
MIPVGRWGIFVMRGVLSALGAGLALAACAGRDPHPVAVVQPQDVQSDCAMIRAESEANNVRHKNLLKENGAKIAQTVRRGASAALGCIAHLCAHIASVSSGGGHLFLPKPRIYAGLSNNYGLV